MGGGNWRWKGIGGARREGGGGGGGIWKLRRG